MSLSVTPEILLPPVWPDPLSLATTRGISVDVFSSPYLDVSVQAVPLLHLFDSVQDTFRWVSPFGNLRINAHLQLPEAYRSLSRPSSAPDAKAFPLRSFSLDLWLFYQSQSTILEKSIYWFSIIVELCRLIIGFLSFLAKIVFLPLQMIFKMSICKTFSLLLPSHNCIIIHNVQFSRCIWVLIPKRLNETSLLRCFSQSL